MEANKDDKIKWTLWSKESSAPNMKRSQSEEICLVSKGWVFSVPVKGQRSELSSSHTFNVTLCKYARGAEFV